MNTQLVDQAVKLFIKTLPLSTLDIDAQPSEFYRLYDLECELFTCMRQMSEEEKQEYRRRVWQMSEQDK